MGAWRDSQVLFAKLLPRLIDHAFGQGYELTFGEVYVKTPRKVIKEGAKGHASDAEHMPNSLHYMRCAADLNLFIEGDYIESGEHPAWEELGVFWEGLDPRCAWGGRFHDANHFSITVGGRK